MKLLHHDLMMKLVEKYETRVNSCEKLIQNSLALAFRIPGTDNWCSYVQVGITLPFYETETLDHFCHACHLNPTIPTSSTRLTVASPAGGRRRRSMVRNYGKCAISTVIFLLHQVLVCANNCPPRGRRKYAWDQGLKALIVHCGDFQYLCLT